jgi:hypothetical protein
MEIAGEKSSYLLIDELGYKMISSDWYQIILGYKRIDPLEDTIDVFIQNGNLVIKFHDLTNFNWEELNKLIKNALFQVC